MLGRHVSDQYIIDRLRHDNQKLQLENICSGSLNSFLGSNSLSSHNSSKAFKKSELEKSLKRSLAVGCHHSASVPRSSFCSPNPSLLLTAKIICLLENRTAASEIPISETRENEELDFIIKSEYACSTDTLSCHGNHCTLENNICISAL